MKFREWLNEEEAYLEYLKDCFSTKRTHWFPIEKELPKDRVEVATSGYVQVK